MTLYRLDQAAGYTRECLSDTRHKIDGFFDVAERMSTFTTSLENQIETLQMWAIKRSVEDRPDTAEHLRKAIAQLYLTLDAEQEKR